MNQRRNVPERAARRKVVLLAAAAVAVLAAGAMITVGLVVQQPEPPRLSTEKQRSEPVPAPANTDGTNESRRTSGTGSAGSADGAAPDRSERVRGPVLGHSEPVRVRIPRLDVDAAVQPLRLDDSGEMQVPSEPADTGWYTGGPAPGALGPAVVTGHVTWNREPAVFFDLATLREGDRIEVAREDGELAVFDVTGFGQYDKDEFPTERVYGPADHAALRLVTCGGEYDDAQHRYADNLVVYAELVDSD